MNIKGRALLFAFIIDKLKKGLEKTFAGPHGFLVALERIVSKFYCVQQYWDSLHCAL